MCSGGRAWTLLYFFRRYLDQSKVENRKQEYHARLYGYNLKIGLTGLIRAYEAGCRNLYEMAEYLDATEEYLKEHPAER